MDPHGCVTWDSDYLSVVGRPNMVTRENSNETAFYQGNGTVREADRYIVEYSAASYADDAARRGADCGIAGDGASGWVSDLSDLPGGPESATSLRFKSVAIPLAPGRAMGLQVPLKRTTNAASLALPVDAPLPWFWQYGTSDTPTVKSAYAPGDEAAKDGGYVQAVPAMVRATTDWSDVSVAPGNVATLTVHPLVIGPVGDGVDTVAKSVDVKVTFSTPCAVPVMASLEATGLDYTYTPGDPGPDGVTCTPDDGAPGSIVFHLGDVTASGGDVGGTFHPTVGGHETLLDLIQFQVMQSVFTPSNSHNVATVVISSPSDASKESWVGALNQAPSAVLTDRTSTTDLIVSGVAAFRGGKTTSTKTPGEVGPDEAFLYTINWGNGSEIPAGPGTFVDLLPYDGDARGTDGLGSAGFKVIDVVAETANPSLMGTVSVEYSNDPSETIAAALALPGNANGDTGINWSTGTPPEDTKAIRVITSDDILPGYSGSATITLKAPELSRGGSLVNDFYGRTAPISGDLTTVRDIYAASTVSLSSNAGLIAGTIYRDTDFDGAVSAGDALWPAGTAIVEAVDTTDGSVVATTSLKSDGSYSFDPIAPGDYDIRLKPSVGAGWTKVTTPTAVAHATIDSGVLLRNVDVLYRENIARTTLLDDNAKVSQNGSVVVDVTANDTLGLPSQVSASKSLDGVRLPASGGAPSYGTVTVTAPEIPNVQSRITYTAASVWPAAFAGQTQYEDTFDYEWVDVLGAVQSAKVTVTVYQRALAANDAVTITSAGGSVNVLENDLGDGITITGTPTAAGDVSATIDGNNLVLASSHVWAEGESSYVTTVGYQITDSQGNTSTASVTVTVVRGPVVTGETSTVIPLDGAASFDPALLDPASIPAGGIVISSDPAAGTARVEADGTITFDADGIDAGTYSFVVQFTDSRNQQVTQTYTVRVQAPPTAQDGSANIGIGQSHTFQANPVTTGSIADARVSVPSSAGSARVTTDGTVIFDSTGATPGSYTFTVEFVDDLGQTGTADYTVVVQDAPVVAGDTHMVIGENQKADFGTVVEVEAEIVSATLTKQPSSGSVILDDAGGVVFDAAGAEPGEYTFEVTYVDENGLTTVVTFTVVVQEAPKAVGGKVTIPLGGHFTFTEQVQTTGRIVDREITTAAAAGTLDLETMDYAAGDAKPGTYTVVVTYTDDVGQQATATFEVTVQAPPTGNGITVTLTSDTDRATFDPIGDSTGTNLQALTDSAFTQPGHGSVRLKNGLLEFVPEPGFFGTTSFTVTVEDDLGQAVVLTYTIHIVNPNGGDGSGDPTGGGRLPETVAGGLAVTGGQGLGMAAAGAVLLAVFGAVLILRRRSQASE
ncbi:hypothetical protein G7067_09070 [Leucobacter insecticola]|uniref:SD-repeat containing protein B domain-containing protein n=1 Tax=Leucobacter insecticola TaxID=2714934 RepID=A0A6G8FJL2_9MICO|nr:Ig-like domain-containing protein [Leucobacter insecticola]QIM16528.1 hypothetical protein G7067_09070 [Leucobacter insecticola]